MTTLRGIGEAIGSIFNGLNSISIFGVSFLAYLIGMVVLGLLIAFIKGKK